MFQKLSLFSSLILYAAKDTFNILSTITIDMLYQNINESGDFHVFEIYIHIYYLYVLCYFIIFVQHYSLSTERFILYLSTNQSKLHPRKNVALGGTFSHRNAYIFEKNNK